MDNTLEIITNSTDDTLNLASKLTSFFPNGLVITLSGDLGAGKTTFVRGVASALNINEVIQSPTFNIMKIYLKGDKPLIHIDAYRLADINNDIGLDEYIGYETGLTFIEWSEFIKNLIPSDSLDILIKFIDDNKRKFTFKTSNNSLYEAIKKCIA